MNRFRCAVAASALVAVFVIGGTSAASAHTEADYVAVPAGSETTINFRPTHGCDESPTIEVSVRAPVEGATAGAVEGWSESATPDGEGHTVLAWTGGVLPAAETGEFPITFTTPDAVGDVLTFASVQACENGEELAWISGDPDSEYPAPRLLVLPAGSEPAVTIEDVAADAPGRDQLTAVVDIDGTDAEGEPDTSSPDGSTTTTTGPSDAQDAAAAPDPTSTDDDSDDGDNSALVPVIVVVVLAGAGIAYLVLRRRPAP